MFKFLHAADIHLDSPFVGLERYEGAPVEQMRQATRRALANLVQLALDEQVRFVLIAGDLYDRDWRDYGTGLFFVNQMTRLRQANIRVFAIAGNHDAANKMTKTLRLQAKTFCLEGKSRADEPIMLGTEKPETRFLRDLDVAIHGQGFASEAVTEDLSAHYPAKEPGCFNIGLLHTCANSDPRGKYAPCSIAGLLSKGYDYWALGHQHKRQNPHDEPPYIVFPGNLQGRHSGEGEIGQKGCMLVTVHDDHSVEPPEFKPLDVLRWELCRVDATEAGDPEAVLSLVADQLGQLLQASDGRSLAVRVEISGRSPANDLLRANPQKWTNEIRSLAIQTAADELWIEKVKFGTEQPRTHVPPPADGPIGELVGLIEEVRKNAGLLQGFQEELAELGRKLPPELKEGTEALRLDDAKWLQRMLDDVRPLLTGRLSSRETPR